MGSSTKTTLFSRGFLFILDDFNAFERIFDYLTIDRENSVYRQAHDR